MVTITKNWGFEEITWKPMGLAKFSQGIIYQHGETYAKTFMMICWLMLELLLLKSPKMTMKDLFCNMKT